MFYLFKKHRFSYRELTTFDVITNSFFNKEKNMLEKLNNFDINTMISTYVVPWGINIIMALMIFIIGRIVVNILTKIMGKLMIKARVDETLVDFVKSIAHTVLLLFVIVASLDQLGVDTTSLVALLGAAGLAIGLSLQSSLQNFAAGVMLLLFKPFKTGDYVEAGGSSGVIQKVNIFTTTMYSPDNKEIIIPNGAIYNGNIINYSARDTRRVDLVFGIGYDDDIKKAKSILEKTVQADQRVLSDPSPTIAVSELADSSVNFVVRPWVKTSDYWDVLFDLTENIKLAFDESGISIPYPQMDVHSPDPKQIKSVA